MRSPFTTAQPENLCKSPGSICASTPLQATYTRSEELLNSKLLTRCDLLLPLTHTPHGQGLQTLFTG